MFPSKIRIQENFSEQYTLEITSNMMAVNAIMKSLTRIRWDLNIIKVKEDFVELRLILLEHTLVEANNPLIKEIARLTSTFSRMYNELHLVIDHGGTILEILNMPAILAKWQLIKTELSEIAKSTPEIKDIIVLNDSIFTNHENLIGYLQKSEFFLLYFHSIFNNRLPYDNIKFIMPNFLNTSNINWQRKIAVVSMNNNAATLQISSRPIFMQSDFNERAYSQFKNSLDINKLTPSIAETGNFLIDISKGKVLEATLKREEVADEKLLYSMLEYKFISDSRLKEINKATKAGAVEYV